MKFTGTQIVEAVKNPKQANDVIKGREYESRLRLFTEPKFKEDLENGKETSWREFKTFMNNALSADKDARISQFIQFPLSSVNITESLLSDLYKVFDAGNSYFNVGTVKKSGGEKMQQLLNKLSLVDWIENTGKKVLKNKPNTVLVIDKNEEGEPYVLAIDNDRLIDIKLKDDGVSAEYVLFLHSITYGENNEKQERYALYDDESYHVVLHVNGEYSVESTIAHNIGYCPARMFINEKLNSKAPFNRKTPLSSALSKIQEWQLFDIYKFYTDHYAPFPVTEMMRAECSDERCSKGWIDHKEVWTVDGEVKENITRKPCPTCQANNNVTVGAKILLDPVEDGDESAAGKFRMISNDVSQLKYLQEKLDSVEAYIKVKVVGLDNILTKEAVNEKQVQGTFESRTNVLMKIKTNLDDVFEWIVITIGNSFIKGKPLTVEANFGTEWYLMSEDELQERFKKGKESGMPHAELGEIYHQLIETKYKGNPEKVERLKIMNRLDAAPYDTLEEKVSKRDNGIISPQELIISERMITFVQRFEFENGSIVEFGEDIEPAKKHQAIVEQFKKYADEYRNETEPTGSDSEGD